MASMEGSRMNWDEVVKHVTFKNALKLGIIIFLYCIMILVVISIILTMFGVY